MPIWEIAIAVTDRGPGRAKAGDIVTARPPTGVLGNSIEERGNVLWLRISTDLQREELRYLQGQTKANSRSFRRARRSDAPNQGKRRYRIDIDDLVTETGIDKSRVINPADPYQPLITQGAVLSHNPQIDKRV